MRDNLRRITELQPEFSHSITDAMIERGGLIRHSCPDWLRGFRVQLSQAMGIHPGDLMIHGSDGMGSKTEIPWFRFASMSRSPSPSVGWYCVYLFDANGEYFYLSLNQASTTREGKRNKVLPLLELRRRAKWGRDQTKDLALTRMDLTESISLNARRSELGPAYESSNALAIRYHRDSIPNEERLLEDALFFAKLLGLVYKTIEINPAVSSQSFEISEIVDLSDQIAGKNITRTGGQGFQLNSAQRLCIEQFAMDKAKSHLQSLGWNVENTASNRPYDFYCTSADGKELYVEVKGTTSAGDAVVLTRGEVEIHREKYPQNALIVIRNIDLIGEKKDTAQGGDLLMFSPWIIDDTALKVVSYIYSLSSLS